MPNFFKSFWRFILKKIGREAADVFFWRKILIFFEVFEIQIQMIFVEALFDGIQTLKWSKTIKETPKRN